MSVKKIKIAGGILLIAIGLLFFILARGENVPQNKLLNFDEPEAYAKDANNLQISPASSSSKRIVISKIGVNMPIIINETNERKALRLGAWLLPGTAAPDSTSSYNNTVISAHRYLYTSGPDTFFNLDKLTAGDLISIFWNGKEFKYIVTDKFIVQPSAVYILDQSPTKILTLFTCNPVYSTKERLVIRALPL